MPILIPGKRDRQGRLSRKGRSAVATLQLTAMVDLFTVLAVFLLQNYGSTGAVISIPKEVELPKATATKELKPSSVVTVSKKEISINNTKIASYLEIQQNKDWLIKDLKNEIQKIIQKEKQNKKTTKGNLVSMIKNQKSKNSNSNQEKIDSFLKLTIQADKNVEYLTVKKVIYTAMESGIREVNFAVLGKEKK